MSAESTTRDHGQTMMKAFSRLGLEQNVFSQPIVNDWNSIPAEVVEKAQHSIRFNSRLDKFGQNERFRLPLIVKSLSQFRCNARPDLNTCNRQCLYNPYIWYQGIKEKQNRKYGTNPVDYVIKAPV